MWCGENWSGVQCSRVRISRFFSKFQEHFLRFLETTCQKTQKTLLKFQNDYFTDFSEHEADEYKKWVLYLRIHTTLYKIVNKNMALVI